MAKEITKPTQKQIDYATRIAADLNISLPEKETSDAYSEFISVNKLKPTIKQKEYAAKIAGILNISLPEKETKTAYKEFVNINKEAFSKRKIELANAVNILDYARSQGLELKRDGRDYRVKNYSGGFIITPEKNSWNWFAENQGGGIVQLCMFLENKTYQEAVDTLVHDDMESIRRAPDWKPEPEQPKEFNLPEKNNTNRHVYAYLTKTRGIDEEIVKDMLDKGYIYENQQKSCVFVGRDNKGVPRHASVRSTNVSGKAYKKDVYGSQKKYSFSISGTSGTLNVFEAPIDLLSYMSLQKLQGKPINDSYLALGGVTDKALERFLEDHKDTKVLRICTDGDDAGKNAASKMDEKFGKDLKVIRQVPEHKDFNEDLIDLRHILAEDVKKNSVTAYEEQIKKQNKIVDEKSAETSKRSKQLTEQIKNGDYKNLNERMQGLLDSMEELTNSVADRTKMRLEEMNRKDWERLLGNNQWIQLERSKELPTEYFEDSKIEKVELLYELEEIHEKEVKSFLAEQINSPDKFYLGYVNGRKELIFRAPVFDSEEYYVSDQATEDYIRGHKSLKELATDIYDQSDLISLAVDEGHLNHAEREKSFVQQVDESLRGDMPFYSSLKVCDTPELLLQVGCEQLPMLYTQKHLRDAVKPVDEQKHQHGLSVDQIKALPQLLESPVMVLDSVSRKDSIVVVTSEFDKEDNPVVVSVKPNGKGRYEIEEINANFITSVYSKNNFIKFFERNIEADSVLYISKEKSQTLFERWGLQLPELTNNLDFDRIIHLSNNIVNSKNIIFEENDHPMMGVNITTDINEDFTREDFTGVKFQGNKIIEAVFTECNFTDALIESEITDTQFIRCNFKNAQIQNTTMEYSDLRENNFEGTNFQGVSIKESSLCRNDFLNTKMGTVYLSNNFVEDNINGNTIQFITEGLFKEEAEIIRRDYMEKLGLTEKIVGISDDLEKMQQGKIPVAIESTIDYENPEIGFTRFATEDMPAGTKYRLVTYGEDGKLVPYQDASMIYNDRTKVQEYIEEHKNELEIVFYDDMVYQAGNRNAEYIQKQNQLIETGLHNFSFDEEGYLHFSININDSSYEGLYRIYDPEKGRSRVLVSIENGEKEPFFEKNWELITRHLELYVNEHPVTGAEGEIIPREKASVYCEWSEHDSFEGDRIYSVSDFDRLMEQADIQWRELRQKEREQYGDADTAFESLRDQGLPQHQGYAKVKYTVYVPGMEPLTLRQDVGDGFGSMIDYIKRTRHKHYGDILDKQKSQELSGEQGLQLPQDFNNADFDKTIHQSENIVDEAGQMEPDQTEPDISISNYQSNEPGQIDFDVNIDNEVHKGQAAFEDDGTVNWVFVDREPTNENKEGMEQKESVKTFDWDKIVASVTELLQNLWDKSKEFMHVLGRHASGDRTHTRSGAGSSPEFNQVNQTQQQNSPKNNVSAERKSGQKKDDVSADSGNRQESVVTDEQQDKGRKENKTAYYLDFKEMEFSDGNLLFQIETPDAKELMGIYDPLDHKLEIEGSYKYPGMKRHWKEIENTCQQLVNDHEEYIMKNKFQDYTGEGEEKLPLNIGNVPNLLVACGAGSHFRFDINQQTIAESLKKGISEDRLFHILNNIKTPIMVLRGDKEKSFLVVTDYCNEQGDPIVVALEERQEGESYERGMEVKGVYGQREYAAYVNAQYTDGRILAVDHKKADILFKNLGGEYQRFRQAISFDERVAYDRDSIKNPPTQKQLAFAKQIAEAMNMEFPEEYSKEAYTAFIGDHAERFREITSTEKKGEVSKAGSETQISLEKHSETVMENVTNEGEEVGENEGTGLQNDGDSRQGIREDDGEYGRVGESSNGGLHENGKEDLSGGSRSLEEGRGTVGDDLEKTEIIGEIKDDIPQALRKLQDEDRINTEVIETLEAMEKTEDVLQALNEAYEERKSITKRVIELTWDKDNQETLADAVLQEPSPKEFSAKSYADFAVAHQQAMKETEVSRIPVVINAFGGPGSGKSVSCMDICQQLKKLGYNAEYVQEYAKELVYDENWDMLNGSPENQFKVLKEQLRRVDRLYGNADFIVTDSPVLLNGVYNKSLTPEYDTMVTSLHNDFENFTYFVERDASAYQQEGRIQNLEESQKIDQDIKQLLGDKGIYYGTYNHDTIDKIVSNAIRTFNRINQTGEEATKKQIAYAEKIAKTLDIVLPKEKTKAAYKEFISENQERFSAINAPLREEGTAASSYQDYLELVAKNGSSLKDVPKEYYTHELFLAAVNNWGNAIRLIPEESLTPEIAMASVQQFGINLKYVPESLRSEEVCVAAYVSSGGKSVRYTPGDMKDRVKEQGQLRLKEDNQSNPNTKRQLGEEKLQEQGQEWITQIENMLKEHESDPEAMIEDIAFAGKFYKYSAKNIQLMRQQNIGLTYVASAAAFEKMGYHIKDNESAMIGRVPVFDRYVTDEQGKRIYARDYTPEIKQKIKEGILSEEQSVRKFKFVAAFYDISQTDCPAEDYPSIFHMGVPSEFHQEAFDAMKEFAEKTLGFKVMVTDLKSISLRGSCEPDNKVIRINERLESTMMLSTLCHEIAHGIIHTSKNSGKMSIAQKECEADVMDIMLESSLGLSINESRRDHLFQSFHAYKEEQAAKERPYEVTLEKLIDRVQTKVFRPYAEDMNYYLDIHLPAEGSQNEIMAGSVIKDIALLDSVSGTDHREEIGKQKEIFDAGRMEEYQELYQRTKEEYRLNNSFVPKLAILKSLDGETFYVQDIRLLDEKTAAMIKEHPEEITMKHLPYNIEAGNILALKESVLADSQIYVVNKEEQLEDVTESLQDAFKIQETRINCSFDVETEYQCLHNLLENGFELEQEYIKRYEYLCSTFDFSKNLEIDSGMRLMAQINLVTEGLSQNNRELIAEYVFRTGNFAKAEDYAKQIENEPGITRKLLQEMKLVDSYKYMLWTIEQYENSNDISGQNRITTGAYNSSAIPVLSENVNSLSQINKSFLLIRKYASPESVKYYAIVEEDEMFRIAYVELNEYQPETVYSTVSFGSHGEAEEFYELYLKTPKTRLADGNQTENLVEMENKENQIALSDITSIGKTMASEKQQYKEMGIDEEGALELLRTEIKDTYPDIKRVEIAEIDNDLQILKDFKRRVAYYGEEHFIELCNLNDFTDKAAVKESFQLNRWLTEQSEILAGMDYTGSEDVKQCVEAALESSVTGTDIEQAFNAIDSAVLSAEFSNLETEFEGFEEYNNVLDTLKAARVTPDKFCYVDFDAAPGPHLYTSDRAGNIYRKPLRDEWDGSVRDLNVRLKEGGYEICSSLDDFKAYSANNRLGIFDPSGKEKNEAYVRILESTNDMLPKNHILSVYDFKSTVDKLYSGSREFNDDITYKLVTRKDKEIHSYIDTYSGNREQNVYEQLYAKAQEKEPVPELSRVISRQYYQDQVSFNENHQIRPLLEQLKKQDKPIEDSEELNALMGTNDKLKEEIRKLDLSPADAELLKLTAGSIQTEQIANMERQMQMNQQAQQQRVVRRQQQEMAI